MVTMGNLSTGLLWAPLQPPTITRRGMTSVGRLVGFPYLPVIMVPQYFCEQNFTKI